MNSRERTLRALDHKEPDRIPVDFWASAGTRDKIRRRTGMTFDEFLDSNDVDLRYIEGPAYVGPPLDTEPGGVEFDIWGVPRRRIEVETADGPEWYRETVSSPLAGASTVAEIEAYPHWPSPDWYDYSVVRDQCEAVHAAGRAVCFMGDRLNRFAQLKPAMYIRGMSEIFTDMAASREMAHAVFECISGFYREYLRRILEAAGGGIDIIVTGDDFGAQNGPLVSPAMWDEFLREGFAGYIAVAHEYGARVMHHTCGAVAPLIPRMIECGLDVLQSLQPEAAGMDPAQLKSLFGRRISFQGGVSIQRTMPFGGADDIRREVARLAAALGPGGGYIFGTAHNIQADTPFENITALFDSWREFGPY